MNFNKNFKILTTIIFAFSFLVFSFPASAQKVLQCAPGQATVNNNLTVNGNLQVNNNAAITNDLTVNKDIYAASGSQKIYLGPDITSPYITNNLNGGEGILFYSNGGQNFLWQSPNGAPGSDAMILRAGGGLPTNNNFNLQVFGQVSPYQLHTMGIHLDSQGIGSGLNSNIIKLTNTSGIGNGAGMFIGDGNDNLIFSAIQGDGSPGANILALDTSNNYVGIAGVVNPQITLAIGDNDTGLKWNSDGNFSLVSNGTQELTIDPGNVRIRNNLCFGVDCKSAWPAAIPETDPTVLASVKDGVAWGELSGIPLDIFDGDQVGITSVPNCGASQKLTGIAGSPVCANDIDTNTDAQTLSVAGSNLSISGGNTVALPAGAADTLDTVTTSGNTTANAITVGGLTVDTDTLFIDSVNNRIGIGTANPLFQLNIKGAASATPKTDRLVRVESTSSTKRLYLGAAFIALPDIGDDSTTLPTCDASSIGNIYLVDWGGGGVTYNWNDGLFICMDNGIGDYKWKSIPVRDACIGNSITCNGGSPK